MLPFRIRGDEIVPQFLDASDYPWVGLLLEDFHRFDGGPRRLLDDHLRASTLRFDAPTGKLRLAIHTLNRMWETKIAAAVAPPAARAALFTEAGGNSGSRPSIVETVASCLQITAQDLEQSLFADLRGERRLVPPQDDVGPSELCLRANLSLVRGLLQRTAKVSIDIEGHVRPVVRHAKLRGLLCSVDIGDSTHEAAECKSRPPVTGLIGATVLARSPDEHPGAGAHLEISGPISLFRHTLVYGRGLSELVPFLARCYRFTLVAEVNLKGRALAFRLSRGAPIFPNQTIKDFDSRVEEKFYRDFARATADWDVVREPKPIQVGRSLIFPDFALIHRHRPRDWWLLEIIGFWTPDYLARKLELLRKAKVPNVILCIDSKLNCTVQDLPPSARVVRYHNKIDAHEVLRRLKSESL